MLLMQCLDHSGTISIHRGIRVRTCPECQRIHLTDSTGADDGWGSMSALFGDFELLGRVDAVHAPDVEVLAYRARHSAGREALRVAPSNSWFKVNDYLWMCHDENLLLLAHGSPSVSRAMGA